MSSADRQSMNEPLLRSTGVTRTPPVQAFQIRDRTETEEAVTIAQQSVAAATDSDAGGASQEGETVQEQERALQRQTLKILGRPYSADSAFWCQSLPVAVMLGFIVGLSSLLFLLVSNEGFGLWCQLPVDIYSSVSVDWKVHLLVTTTGGFLTGLIYLLPQAPRPGTVRTFVHATADLQGNAGQSLVVTLASCVALVTGAPVGPEQGLGAIGSGIATVLSNLWRVPRRTEALWIQTGLAAALGGLFQNIIVGPAAIHELTVTSRPDKLTLDALVADQGPRSDTDPTNGVVSTASTLRPDNHDYIEGLTLMVLATTVASLMIRCIYPDVIHLSRIMPVSNDFQVWHLAAAVPLGFVCGLVGSAVVVLTAMFRRTRERISQLMLRFGAPIWLVLVSFPALAGLFHGLLSVAEPYAAGNGLALLRDLWNAASNAGTVLNVDDLPRIALTRVVGLALSLGFGLMGGAVLPTAVVGMCVGVALSLSISALPLSLAVTCCVAACPVAFLPTPLTAVVAVVLAMNCSADQSGPILIACVVAFTTTGGTGVLRYVGERRLAESEIEDADESELPSGPSLPSDDEILQSVRSAIFGSV